MGARSAGRDPSSAVVTNAAAPAAAYALLSVAIVAFHVVAWLATFPATGPEGFWAFIGWPGATALLGSAWTLAFAFACWRLVASAAPHLVAALTVLIATILTTDVLGVMVNLPYKGISSSEFLDAFLVPGGITPGGNGTLQSILMIAFAAGIAAVHLAHAARSRRGRTVVP